ncbi:MAG: malonic semialdehyde reductase, partial [Glutamicibacter ardleyensis]
VRAVGLAAGPMAGFDAAAIDAVVNADGRNKSFLIVNVGKPGADAWFGRLPRHDAQFATRSI